MNKRANLPHRTRGFTLIEVMVTLVLMSLAMTLMMAGLRYSAKAWSSAERRMSAVTDLQVARRLISTTLGQASRTIIGEGDEKRYLFKGDKEAVTFATYMPPYPDQAGLYLTTLFIVKEEDIYQLRLKRRLLTPDILPFSHWQAEEDVLVWQTQQPLSFAYYGPVGDLDGAGSWQNQWDESQQILQLVKLQISASNDEKFAWPDLVVRTHFDMTGHCIDHSTNELCRLPL
ncbi:MAG: prepilin-type N-terminal cleavage/methylation domain-containing protein [Candidatus Polarisedimenticolaceae bacterium]|nr:prepilin-type N-terminal cleavage/methylation domain-containing protein [Candidatus Polarisedimenticolaceae bacterium]